jgi:serine/threonine-protein kinase
MERSLGSRYLLDEPLGRGASGTVWRGRVRGTDEPVAVKILREELARDPDVVTRFLRERALLLRIRHPNLIRVHDLVVEGEVLALVMELVNGPDLRTHLRGEGRLRPAAAAGLMAPVLDALAVTHQHRIVHRDLKPANILLRPGRDGLFPLLSDFGIARSADGTRLTRTRELLGTPHYLAPETAVGATPTSAVDVYAAGIVLYELVAGRPPFDDPEVIALVRRHVEEVPARPPGVPDPLWRIIADCLRKDPAERPRAVAVARALREAASAMERQWFRARPVGAAAAGGAGAAGRDGAAGVATGAAARFLRTLAAAWTAPLETPPAPPPGPSRRPEHRTRPGIAETRKLDAEGGPTRIEASPGPAGAAAAEPRPLWHREPVTRGRGRKPVTFSAAWMPPLPPTPVAPEWRGQEPRVPVATPVTRPFLPARAQQDRTPQAPAPTAQARIARAARSAGDGLSRRQRRKLARARAEAVPAQPARAQPAQVAWARPVGEGLSRRQRRKLTRAASSVPPASGRSAAVSSPRPVPARPAPGRWGAARSGSGVPAPAPLTASAAGQRRPKVRRKRFRRTRLVFALTFRLGFSVLALLVLYALAGPFIV